MNIPTHRQTSENLIEEIENDPLSLLTWRLLDKIAAGRRSIKRFALHSITTMQNIVSNVYLWLRARK